MVHNSNWECSFVNGFVVYVHVTYACEYLTTARLPKIALNKGREAIQFLFVCFFLFISVFPFSVFGAIGDVCCFQVQKLQIFFRHQDYKDQRDVFTLHFTPISLGSHSAYWKFHYCRFVVSLFLTMRANKKRKKKNSYHCCTDRERSYKHTNWQEFCYFVFFTFCCWDLNIVAWWFV